MIKLNLKAVTPQDVIDSTRSEYNPWEWKRTVMGYTEHADDVQFYTASGYRENFAVLYTIDGVRFFDSVKYGSSLSAGDPFAVHIEPANEEYVSVSDSIQRGEVDKWKMVDGYFVAHIDTKMTVPNHLRKTANFILTKDTLW